jgi:gliding motility-associated-like protein
MLQGSSSTGNNMQYAWATQNGNITSGNNSQTSTVDEPGTYALTVTNPQNGCTATDNVTVGAIPPPIFAPALTQPDCHDKNGAVDFGAVTGGQEPFVYSSDGGQTFGAQSLADNLPPDVYTLVVQDALGCTATQNVTINQPFTPTVSIPAVTTLLVGDSVLLQPVTNISPSDIASWSWTPPDGLSCDDCATPWARPFRSANYNVVVVDENGCQATAQVQVRVNRQRDLYAPNVFSPNDDGENDRFMLYARGVKEIQSLQVFDRWGNALFLGEHLQPGDEQAGWDGTYRGDPMTPAVFVWWARVEFVDGEVEVVKGDVTLVR